MIVITRHPALRDLLIERGMISETDKVITHASAAQVRGQDVIGVLPLSLAAEANTITEIELNIRPERRGMELSLDELRDIAGPAVTYIVRRKDRS